MRKLIFILILLTVCGFARAQEMSAGKPVRVVFTANFQNCPFGQDPVWGGWPEASMARAMSYIRSHRRAIGEDRFALVDCSEELPGVYSLYPADFSGRILAYSGYGKIPAFARVVLLLDRTTDLSAVALESGVDLVVAAFGREPDVCRVVNIDGDTVTLINLGMSGKYIGVADFRSSADFTAKVVDISGFPADAEYEDYFRPLFDSVRAYYNTPLTKLTQTVRQSDALFGASPYTGLFHRFQLEATGADVSLFACPVWGDSIPAGGITPRDIVQRFRYDNRLSVISMSGRDIVGYLEYVYGLRYNTVRRSTDGLLRLVRDRDGTLQTRSAIYNLDNAAGIRYEVDVSRPEGKRVRVLSMADGTPFDPAKDYRVVLNSHRAEGIERFLQRAGQPPPVLYAVPESGADYRVLLRVWLAKQPEIVPGNPNNWQVVPESFVETAKRRFNAVR